MSIENEMGKGGRAKRAQLLAGAGTMVLATFLAVPAHAATAIVNADQRTAQVDAGLVAQSLLSNDARVEAAVTDTTGGIIGNQNGGSATVTGNRLASTAAANSGTTALATTGGQQAGGAAVLSNQTNSEATVSRTKRNQIMVMAGSVDGSTVAATGNQISADTTVNRSTASLASSAAGTTSGTYGNGSINTGVYQSDSAVRADADLIVASVQRNTANYSSANARDNTIGLDIGSANGAGAPALEDNTIAATYAGNAAANGISITDGGMPAFAGSALVANMQSNEAKADKGQDLMQSNVLFDEDDDSFRLGATNYGARIEADLAYGAPMDVMQPLGIDPTGNAGGLTVTGNAITATATGNQATGANGTGPGNRITIASGVSVAGNQGGYAGSSISSSGSDVSMGANADLTILSSQRNVGAGELSASTVDGVIVADARSLQGGLVDVSANTVSAAAIRNQASSLIDTGTGAANVSATVAIANQQSNSDSGTRAESLGNAIVATGGQYDYDGEYGYGPVDGATVSLTGNANRATAYGNSASQAIALDGVSMPLASGPAYLYGSTYDNGYVQAQGAATIANVQRNEASPTSAEVYGSLMLAQSNADDAVNSRIEASSNAQEAVAIANSASNGLALSGTTLGSGAGIASVQINDAASPTQATVAGSIIVRADDAIGSTLAVTDNVQRALAYGNSAANNLQLTANRTQVDTYGYDGPGDYGQPAFGVLSQQRQDASVTATAYGYEGPSIGASIGTDLEDGASATVQGNALVAAAYGNQASSGANLALGNVERYDDGYYGSAGIAAVLSSQQTNGNVLASVGGDRVIGADVYDDVEDSTLAVTGNSVQALAYGNRANGNTLSVTGGNIATSGSYYGQPTFALGNDQSVYGSVSATQRSGDGAAWIGATVGSDVEGAAITLADNLSSTQATANAAVNQLSLAAGTLATGAGVQNQQYGTAQVSATAGQPAIAPSGGSLASPFAYQVTAVDPTQLNANFGGTTGEITSGMVQVAASTLTPAQQQLLQSQGWSMVGANLRAPGSVLGGLTYTQYGTLLGGQALTLSAVVPAVPPSDGRPARGGVQLTVGYDVENSTLAVTGNTATAGAVVNNAANTLTASATQLAGEGKYFMPFPPFARLNAPELPSADMTLANRQSADFGASATAEIFGANRIDTADGAEISGSTLSVQGNSQVANALVNAAANALTLTATGMGENGPAPRSQLSSDQSVYGAPVTATSNLDLSAPTAAYNSTISIADNSNVALGVMNDVANTLSVSGTNVAGNSYGLASATGYDQGYGFADGDHVLDNAQHASGSVVSNAETTIGDSFAAGLYDTGGTYGSTLSVTGNATTAEASANRALNTAAVSGVASQSATTALANRQSSTADVAATATTTAQMALGGYDDLDRGIGSTVDNSSVALNGNATTALARGNAATNTMTGTASNGAFNGFMPVASGASTSTADGMVSASAPAVVLNSQTNGGAVSAMASGSYAVALNSGYGLPASGSTATVSGNSVGASAYGNAATNTLKVTAISGGTSGAAVANYQLNSGAVSATATSVTFGAGSPAAGMIGTSMAVSGNQVTASAIGNSVATTLTAGR